MNDGGDSLMRLCEDGRLDFGCVEEVYGYKIVKILGADNGQRCLHPPVSILTTKNGSQHHVKVARCSSDRDLEVLKCIRHRHIAPVSDVHRAEGREFAAIVTDWVDCAESQCLARELAPGVVGGIFSAIGYLSARLGDMPFNLKPTNIILHRGVVRLHDWFLPYLAAVKNGGSCAYTVAQDRKGLSQWLVRSLTHPKHHALTVARGGAEALPAASPAGAAMDIDEKTEAEYQSFLLSLTTTEEDVTDHAWVKPKRGRHVSNGDGGARGGLLRSKQNGKHPLTFVVDRRETVLLLMYAMLKGISSRRPVTVADLASLKGHAEREADTKSRVTPNDVDNAFQFTGSPAHLNAPNALHSHPDFALHGKPDTGGRGPGYNASKDVYEITACSHGDAGGAGEDVFTVVPNLSKFLGMDGPGEFACCVMDGHAGVECAVYCAHQLLPAVRLHPLYEKDVEEAIRDTCHDIHSRFIARGDKVGNTSGSTLAMVIIRNGVLYAANLGDSAIVLASGGEAVCLSKDHVPTDPTERSNVELRGGTVINMMGIDRVEGELSLTRSIGDSRVANYLSREPHVVTRVLTPDDEVLVLASDGLWDVISAEECVSFILQCKAEVDGQLKSPHSPSSPSKASMSRSSRDAGDEDKGNNFFAQPFARLGHAHSGVDMHALAAGGGGNIPLHGAAPPAISAAHPPAPPSITIEGSTPSVDGGLEPGHRPLLHTQSLPESIADIPNARVFSSMSRRSSVQSVESFRRELKLRSQAEESVCTSADEPYDDYQILAEALIFEARERGSQDDIAVCLVVLNSEAGLREVPS
eukprot:TRINITY_DN5316_c1_g1_i1.p1 TRINITY_DN5316_c1_g1~~TRINITY_DN5316_c1_g1_i1.p1  ORF type:complete len:876 (+),score=251.59 TRINITY_DN5316_c1_g1_i1:203-2629(+)